MNWLARAQDNSKKNDPGISTAFYLYKGWQNSYPETTGYIINTFLEFCRKSGNDLWLKRSISASNWLLTLQIENQGFPGSYNTDNIHPRVFNTGMILFGLAEIALVTNNQHYFSAGQNALDWLVNTQDADGSWCSISPEKLPHAYHSRVAWGMLEMAKALYGYKIPENYITSITKNLEWVFKQQKNNGWFFNNDLIVGLPPLTHNIAYTIRGLLESGIILQRNDFIISALKSASKLMDIFTLKGYLQGGYDEDWNSNVNFRCLTGEAQIGIIWLRLYEITNDKNFINAAKKIALQVAKTQIISSKTYPSIRGGIAGSYPIWGKYVRFGYPNWAGKFFADLLMALDDLI